MKLLALLVLSVCCAPMPAAPVPSRPAAVATVLRVEAPPGAVVVVYPEVAAVWIVDAPEASP